MSLRSVLSANKLSIGSAARALSLDKSTVSKICSRTYPSREQKEEECIRKLREKRYGKTVPGEFSADTGVPAATRPADSFLTLADDLISEGSLRSSPGMITGAAERGKTRTSKWYAETRTDACCVLFIEGSTKVQLLRDICGAVSNIRPVTFGACPALIRENCRIRRRLLIIDEADKCPVSFLELLRGVNERCSVPVLPAGGEGLKSEIDGAPRLRSRIRKPIVLSDQIGPIDIGAFYASTCGIDIDRRSAEVLAKRFRGAFRTAVNDALAPAGIGRASGIAAVTPAMIDALAQD